MSIKYSLCHNDSIPTHIEYYCEAIRNMPRQFTDDEMRQRIALQKKALEITCYVVGAGAFSVFIRWLQTMLAFNEDGLVDRSIFNFLVPLMVIIAGYIFLRFVDRFRADRWYVPDDFYDAFYNAS